MKTYQHFNLRMFTGLNPFKLIKAVAEFQQLAMKQEEIVLTMHVHHKPDTITGVMSVDMSNWPDDIAFDSWFCLWAERHNVAILD